MRAVEHARSVVRRISSALALVVLAASSASAQLVVDGNLLFHNGASGTLAGQFVGAPSGASLTLCNTTYSSAGYSAGELATVTFPHNRYADPLLPNAAFPLTNPKFQPLLGSPNVAFRAAKGRATSRSERRRSLLGRTGVAYTRSCGARP